MLIKDLFVSFIHLVKKLLIWGTVNSQKLFFRKSFPCLFKIRFMFFRAGGFEKLTLTFI